MQFINQTGTQNEDPETRQAIRRHVMLGKNKGKRPRPKQPSVPGAAVLSLNNAVQASSNQAIPPRVGSDISFLKFADSVDESLMNETLHFCSVTNEHMYVLEPCIAFETYDPVAMCFYPLASDALYMNTLVFSSKIFRDIAAHSTISGSRRGNSNLTLEHYGKAITLMRERVSENESTEDRVSVMTIMAAILLAFHALVIGHAKNARNHLEGMARMIHVQQGGLESFKDRTKQLIEILRCDLSIALATGQPPLLNPLVFLEDNKEDSDALSLQEPFGSEVAQLSELTLGSELTEIWIMLKHFCARINTATTDQAKVTDRKFLHAMASAMYEAMRTSASVGHRDELIQLAMLSFSASIFLQWRQVRVPLPWLQRRYQDALIRLARNDTNDTNPGFDLWLFLIYGVSYTSLLPSESEELRLWLSRRLQQCGLSSWADVRSAMEPYLWIDIICDGPAKALVDQALGVGGTDT